MNIKKKYFLFYTFKNVDYINNLFSLLYNKINVYTYNFIEIYVSYKFYNSYFPVH